MVAGDEARQSEPALITTKLSHRHDGQATVLRGRLLTHLSQLLTGRPRVAAVEAPAGYGKSTLLSQWREHITERGIASGWLSLEAADNDPARFLSYLTAALAPLLPDFDPRLRSGFLAGNPISIDSLLATMVKALERDARPFVLFLDDFHVIGAGEVHAIVSRLVWATPAHLSFVIAGRHRAPLPFAQLKLNDELLEVSPEDLAFRDDEVRTFMRDVKGIVIDDALLRALSNRAEGWIAGLQLAALALRNTEDAGQFIRDFSGSDHDITNYLGEVVLDRLPEEIREFLLCTSVLGRMNASLCDAITDRRDGQRMLERVASAHLFLHPLDRDRKWYRYHQLFSDFLANRLETLRPGMKTTILSAASAWSHAHGYATEAVDYAFEASSIELAAEIISSVAPDLAHRHGELHTVLAWVDKLPAVVLCRFPKIQIANAWCLTFCRRWEAANAQMLSLERAALEAEKLDDMALACDAKSIRSSIEMNRAIAFALQDQCHLSRDSCAKWLKDWPNGDAVDIAAVATALVYSTINTFEFELGRQKYAEARRACEKCANDYAIAWNFCSLGMIALRQGQLKEAIRIYLEGLEVVAHGSTSHSFMTSLLSIFLAEAFYEANNIATAHHYLTEARPFLSNHGTVEVAIAGYNTQAKLCALENRHADALSMLREAEQLGYQSGLLRLSATMLSEQIAVHLRCGDRASAIAVAERAGFLTGSNPLLDQDRREAMQEIRRLAWVRMQLFDQAAERTLPLLTQDIASAKRSGRIRRQLELQILRANALWLTGKEMEALREMDAALSLAAPQGFIRVFVDEGPLTRTIIERLATLRAPFDAAKADTIPQPFFRVLLEALSNQAPEATIACSDGNRSTTEAMVVSCEGGSIDLTRRELQLLKLIDSGCSNSELAATLFISEQTVKWHLHNLFIKLGAKNRTSAIARARKLALL